MVLIFLSIAGREFEYQDTFEEGMRIQDSLWNEIKAIEYLEDKYYILPKNKWEEHSLDRGNFESDYNIFGGTIYLKRLKPSNLEFH